MTINFDMDGTFVDLYGVPKWWEKLDKHDPTPYIEAKPLVRLSVLARHIHKFQKAGYKVNVISWLAKSSTPKYDVAVIDAKREWLRKHLPSVRFDGIYIVPYGTPKSNYVPKDRSNLLIDDEIKNLAEWEKAKAGFGIVATEMFELFKTIK